MSLVSRYVRRRQARAANRQEVEAANPVAEETEAVPLDLTIAARGMVLSIMETVGLMSVDDFLAEAVSSGFTPEGDIWMTGDVVGARDRIREARAEAVAPRVAETTGPDWHDRFASVARRLPNWQRPSWLRMPNISRPQIQRPSWLRMPELQISEVSRKRIRTAFGITAVVLIAILILWFVLQQPPVDPATVVEEPVAAATVEPTVMPESTVTTEPTIVPAQVAGKVVVVGRVKETVDKAASGAEVSVGESNSRTDAEGIFRVPEVPKADEYTLNIVTEDVVRRITREGGGFLSGPTTDDVGEFLLSDAEVVGAETTVETEAQTETEEHIVTVKSGDTLWDLLEEELGQAPTWEQIKSVVDANSLNDQGVNEAGLWIVLIQIDQTIDLSAGLT